MLRRTLLRLKKEGGEQRRIDERKKKRRNEITLFHVFYIPLFIIISTNYYLLVHSFSFFFFSYTHLQYDYEYKRRKESEAGILFFNAFYNIITADLTVD
jgi:hypothetical protein